MSSIITISLDIAAVFGCIDFIIGMIALIYIICKAIYLDIKGAEGYKDYFRNLYESKYEEDIDKVKKDSSYAKRNRN
jgi:hypothetical protein